MTAKYICIEYGQCGDTIIVFPAHITHGDFAHNIPSYNHPLSAGFIRQVESGRFVCFGESESTGLKSRPEIDSALVNKMFGR